MYVSECSAYSNIGTVMAQRQLWSRRASLMARWWRSLDVVCYNILKYVQIPGISPAAGDCFLGDDHCHFSAVRT